MINDTLLIQLRNSWSNALWRLPHTFPLTESQNSWLTETKSMTRRFEQYASGIAVEPLFEGFVDSGELTAEREQLPANSQYWLREVILYGDGLPWLWARTVIPEQTLTEEDRDLMALNKTPLGHYLFRSDRLSRDYIQVAQCGSLWGRRSRLRLSGKPLLLTEVFLLSSPLY